MSNNDDFPLFDILSHLSSSGYSVVKRGIFYCVLSPIGVYRNFGNHAPLGSFFHELLHLSLQVNSYHLYKSGYSVPDFQLIGCPPCYCSACYTPSSEDQEEYPL